MIQPELLGRLRTLADSYRLPVPALTERVNGVAPVPGAQPVLVEVESRLPDGRFRVVAAGERFDVNLPATAKPGDLIRIFLRAQPPGTPAPNGVPAAEPRAGSARLSELGRLIADMAARSPEGRAPAQLGAPRPLLPDAPLDAKLAAVTLRELIALSGLFYESHQAEWVEGGRDVAQLRREPQNRLAPHAGLPARAGGAESAEDTGAVPRPAQSAPPSVHRDALPIVQQQLQALEMPHIVWSGQIWPGQPLRWEIEQLQQRAPQDPDDAAARWQTRLELELPNLGRIGALLTLAGGALQVRLHAASAQTHAVFGARLAELHAGLAGAGLAVSGITRDGDGTA